MKLIAMLGAGALAIGTMVAAPADAQHWSGHRGGYNGERGHGERWHGGGFRGGARGYRGGYRSYGGYRGRVVCRVHRGYYGPVRRCFRVFR